MTLQNETLADFTENEFEAECGVFWNLTIKAYAATIDLNRLTTVQLKTLYDKYQKRTEIEKDFIYHIDISLSNKIREDVTHRNQIVAEIINLSPDVDKIDFSNGNADDLLSIITLINTQEIFELSIQAVQFSDPIQFEYLMRHLSQNQFNIRALTLKTPTTALAIPFLNDFIKKSDCIDSLVLCHTGHLIETNLDFSHQLETLSNTLARHKTLRVTSFENIPFDLHALKNFHASNLEQLAIINGKLCELNKEALLNWVKKTVDIPRLKLLILAGNQLTLDDDIFLELIDISYSLKERVMIFFNSEGSDRNFSFNKFYLDNSFSRLDFKKRQDKLLEIFLLSELLCSFQPVLRIKESSFSSDEWLTAFHEVLLFLTQTDNEFLKNSYYRRPNKVFDVAKYLISNTFSNSEKLRAVIKLLIDADEKLSESCWQFDREFIEIIVKSAVFSNKELFELLVNNAQSTFHLTGFGYGVSEFLENIQHTEPELTDIINLVSYLPKIYFISDYVEKLYKGNLFNTPQIDDAAINLNHNFSQFFSDSTLNWITCVYKILYENFGLSRTEDSQIAIEKLFSDVIVSIQSPHDYEQAVSNIHCLTLFMVKLGAVLTMGKIHFDPNDATVVIEAIKLLIKYPDPEYKKVLSRQLINNIFSNQTGLSLFRDLLTPKRKKESKPGLYKIGPIVGLITLCLDEPLDLTETSKIIRGVLEKFKGKVGDFYQQGLYSLLTKGIFALETSQQLSKEQKIEIVAKTLSIKTHPDKTKVDKSDIELQKQVWMFIEGLATLGKVDVLTEAFIDGQFEYNRLKCIFSENICSLILESIPDDTYIDRKDLAERLEQFYKIAFEPKEQCFGLVTYLGKIKSLASKEKLTLLLQYIFSVLSEDAIDFYQFRYANPKNIHIKKIFDRYPDIQKTWPTLGKGECFGKTLSSFSWPVSLNENVNENHLFDMETFFYQRIMEENHLGMKFDLNKFIYLPIFFGKTAQEQSDILRLLNEAYKKANDVLKKFERYPNLNEQESAFLCRFEYHLLNFIYRFNWVKTQDKDWVEPCLNAIDRAASRIIAENAQIFQDLTILSDAFKGSKTLSYHQKSKNYDGATVSLSDDYWDLFMCGTAVQGSCQLIYGDPELNQCLLAYMMDGKNQLLVIKDRQGNILARAILRLMLTDNGPILFKEENYPAPIIDPILNNALNLYAKEIAEKLELSLCAKNYFLPEEQGIARTNVYCLDGISPVEYVDAIRSVSYGKFSIPNCLCLYHNTRYLMPKEEPITHIDSEAILSDYLLQTNPNLLLFTPGLRGMQEEFFLLEPDQPSNQPTQKVTPP